MRKILALLAVLCLTASVASAQTQIQVKVETTSNLGIAPVIAGFSDGSFDIFTVGSAASAALEEIAETGSPAGFAPPEGGAVFGNNPPPGPPVFTPGGMSSAIFNVSNGNTQFSMAAMLLPSNDWFVGREDFDISSLLNAANGTSLSFDLMTVYDAGTETEDFSFSAGNPIMGLANPGDGGPDSGTDQGGVVSMVNLADPFGSFVNTDAADAGFDTTPFDFANSSIARVTLTTVPEPTGLVLAMGCLGGLLLIRRKK